MTTEPVALPAYEAYEPNTKKKVVHNGDAIEFPKSRQSQGLAGLIMFLPIGAKGVPRSYLSLNHPVVILSPTISADNTVEIVGVSLLKEDIASCCPSERARTNSTFSKGNNVR